MKTLAGLPLRNRLCPCVSSAAVEPEFPPGAPNTVSEGTGGPVRNCRLGSILAIEPSTSGMSHHSCREAGQVSQASRALWLLGGSGPAWASLYQLARVGPVENSPKKENKKDIVETMSALAKP